MLHRNIGCKANRCKRYFRKGRDWFPISSTMQEICTNGQVQNKEQLTERPSLAKGYPEDYIGQQRKQDHNAKDQFRSKGSKSSLPYHLEVTTELTKLEILSQSSNAYSTATLCLLRPTKKSSFQNHSNCLAYPNVSEIVYQFISSCGEANKHNGSLLGTTRIDDVTLCDFT